MEILLAVLGGSTVAAFINQVGEYIRARKNHEEKTETKEDEDIKALKEAMKMLLMDRIKEQAHLHLKEKEITFEDRKHLHEMHNVYKALGENGDLTPLMEEIDELPTKLLNK